MTKSKYEYLYGPVASWRLASSLGVDPLSQREKICSFDCVYCQIGRTDILTVDRKVFVPTAKLLKELEKFPDVPVDYITFSGRGEPTLAANLGEMIAGAKRLRKEKIAVITNSTMLFRPDVRAELVLADFVLAKLDAPSQEIMNAVNRPSSLVAFDVVLSSIIDFRREFSGKFALQMMFVRENKNSAKEMVQLANKIAPDEIQLNTPLRKCAVTPISEHEMKEIEGLFVGFRTLSVYSASRKIVAAVSQEDTLKRRGKT